LSSSMSWASCQSKRLLEVEAYANRYEDPMKWTNCVPERYRAQIVEGGWPEADSPCQEIRAATITPPICSFYRGGQGSYCLRADRRSIVGSSKKSMKSLTDLAPWHRVGPCTAVNDLRLVGTYLRIQRCQTARTRIPLVVERVHIQRPTVSAQTMITSYLSVNSRPELSCHLEAPHRQGPDGH